MLRYSKSGRFVDVNFEDLREETCEEEILIVGDIVVDLFEY